MIAHHEQLQEAPKGLVLTQSPTELHRINDVACPAVIWDRQPSSSFQKWIDALPPEQLPSTRVILPPEEVRGAVAAACLSSQTPDCPECTQLIDDIGELTDIFADIMKCPFVRLRLDRISNNACRKFHVDALTARLICTFRGAPTQFANAADTEDASQIMNAPVAAPIMLRGTLWPEEPPSGLLHRSPQIEGTGETRLVLVLDPIFDVEEET